MDQITQYTEETYLNSSRTSVSRERPPAAKKPKRRCQAVLKETLLPRGKSIKVTCDTPLRIAIDDETQIDLCRNHGRMPDHFTEYCETHENNPEWTSLVLKATEELDEVPQTSKEKKGKFRDIYYRYKPKPKSVADEPPKRFDTPPSTEERDELIFLPYKPEVDYTVLQTPVSTRTLSVPQSHDIAATAEYDTQIAGTIQDTLPERERNHESKYRFYHEDPSKLYKRTVASKKSRHLILPNDTNDVGDIPACPSSPSPSQLGNIYNQNQRFSTYADPAGVAGTSFDGAGGGLPTPQNDINKCDDIWPTMPNIEAMHNDLIPQSGFQSEMAQNDLLMGLTSQEINCMASNGPPDTLISQTRQVPHLNFGSLTNNDSAFDLHQNMFDTTYLRSEPAPAQSAPIVGPVTMPETPLDLEATLEQYQRDTGVAIAYPASNLPSNEPLPVGTRYDFEPAGWNTILSPPESENEVGASNLIAEGGVTNVQDDYPSYNTLSIQEAQNILDNLESGTSESYDIPSAPIW